MLEEKYRTATLPHERDKRLDVMRGVALLGLILMNIVWFHSPLLYAQLLGESLWTSDVDVLLERIVSFFGEGTVYALFTFLFGVGFMLFIERAQEHHLDAATLFRRRLFVFFLLGFFHFVLLWVGDVFMLYAIIGLFLLHFRKRKPKTMLVWASLLLIIPIGLMFLVAGSTPESELETSSATSPAQWMPTPSAAVAETVENGQALELPSLPDNDIPLEEQPIDIEVFAEEQMLKSYEKYGDGTFNDMLYQRLVDALITVQNTIPLVPFILAMFLLGAYVIRQYGRHVLDDRSRLLRWCFVSWAIALPLSFIRMTITDTDPLTYTMNDAVHYATVIIGGPAFAIAIMTSIALLSSLSVVRFLAAPFAAAGRMPVTNYLMQSLVCVILFYNIGFGLYGTVSYAEGIGLAILIFIGQMIVSSLWLRVFAFGPFEWLVRSVTYWELQPFRRSHHS